MLIHIDRSDAELNLSALSEEGSPAFLTSSPVGHADAHQLSEGEFFNSFAKHLSQLAQRVKVCCNCQSMIWLSQQTHVGTTALCTTE